MQSQALLLKKALGKYRYSAKRIQDFGIDPAVSGQQSMRPALEYQCRKPTAFNTLLKLFLVGVPVDRGPLLEVFAEGEIDLLIESGLLARHDDKRIKAGFRAFPYKDFTFFCDFPTRGTDGVYCPGADSQALAETRVDQKFESGLDLCTGTGIQAILASRQCREVTGVDINPRAVEVANLNLILNGVENVRFLLGDLYQAVGDQRFDLITANPPFVPCPSPSETFRYGGPEGDAIFRDIVSGLPSHLEKNGFCQIVTNILEFEEGAHEDFIRESAREHGYRTLILTGKGFDKYSYATSQYQAALRNPGYAELVTAFLEHLDSKSFKEGWLAVITFNLGVTETQNDGHHDDIWVTAMLLLTDPETVRFQQRVEAGLASINGVALAPLQDTVELGRRMVEFRASLTAKVVRKSIESASR